MFRVVCCPPANKSAMSDTGTPDRRRSCVRGGLAQSAGVPGPRPRHSPLPDLIETMADAGDALSLRWHQRRRDEKYRGEHRAVAHADEDQPGHQRETGGVPGQAQAQRDYSQATNAELPGRATSAFGALASPQPSVSETRRGHGMSVHPEDPVLNVPLRDATRRQPRSRRRFRVVAASRRSQLRQPAPATTPTSTPATTSQRAASVRPTESLVLPTRLAANYPAEPC
jgi:hypothetical protein